MPVRAASVPSSALTSQSDSVIGQHSGHPVHVEVEDDSDVDQSSRRSSHSHINQWGGGLDVLPKAAGTKQVTSSERADSPHDVTVAHSVTVVNVTSSLTTSSCCNAHSSYFSSAASSKETLIAESSSIQRKSFPRSSSFNVLRRQTSRDDDVDGVASQSPLDQPISVGGVVPGLKKIRSSDRLFAHTRHASFSRVQVF